MPEALSISTPPNGAMASVIARNGVAPAAIGARLGLTLDSAPRWSRGDGLIMIGVGPGCWLARADTDDPYWAESLRARLLGLAAVMDQSSGFVVTRLAGREARALLQRGLAIDLDPTAFGPGAAAVTRIGQMGVTCWQLDDQPSYDLAIVRSLAANLHRWLEQTAASL